MLEPLSYLTAFLLGIFGSLHCMGMCGGIVGALSVNTGQQSIKLQLSYHLGRISMYGLIGLLAGFAGLWLSQTHDYAGQVLRGISGVLLILMGIYILGSSKALLWLEKAGSGLWKRIQPLSRSLIPISNIKQAIALGLIWGLLPCGLVYSTLSWALVAANPLHSASLMVAFGLGNMPALLSLAAFTGQINRFKQNVFVKAFVGLGIIGFGIWTLVAPILQINH
ncbi:sulfite exporter TauE/SafE family protein [Oceaniserpentilla sp. 4NH20-0058]|uniref:sulfite exporter TauE/SafE family protein n=1 Tax=Oceaniserpentilla sp. 4NH20-0058 TaxID=3127660 RepID=UPI0031061481